MQRTTGEHQWYIAPSGTTGNTITFTQAMTLDVSGNLGIGTTSPGSKLDVKGTLRLSGSSSGYVGLAPAAAAGSATYTLPSALPTVDGQLLSCTTAGVMSWSSTLPTPVLSVQYLVVAGGGGGGRESYNSGLGGGGGAGGLLTNTTTLSTATNYTVTVGGPGSGVASGGAGSVGGNGSNSVFSSFTATGGGGGGGGSSAGNLAVNSGGSGGGARGASA